jgi:hypothetical protein
MHPFDTLLEKAKEAHFHWSWNNPQSKQIEAMRQLGDAIQDVEALAPRKETFIVGGEVIMYKPKEKKRHGDRQKFRIYRGFVGKNLYIFLEIHTLTAQPYRYAYKDILRRINGLFLLENTIGMPLEVWAMTSNAINEIYTAEKETFFNKPTEKANGTD